MGTPPDQASASFIPHPPPLFAAAISDHVITLWPQNPADQAEFEAPPFKRPRNSDGIPLNPLAVISSPPNAQTNPPPNPPTRGTNCVFFKTRLCQKFKARSCPWGGNCNFAHGIEELRQPPPNWQELVAVERVNGSDRQRMHRNKICRKFYNGEVCPYGDRCTYLHVERESSGMVVGSVAGLEQGGNGSGLHNSDSTGGFSSVGDCNGSNQKPKMKICYKWETTGHCSFGERCIYTHSRAELKKSGGHVELDGGKIGAAPSKPASNSTNDAPLIKTESTCMHQAQQKKSVFPNLSKKLSCIYADWIDDIPLFSRTS
ncbi:zinc finger CCCH domain-containing protein 39-like [Phoenix dactylifera]|uniref:Zinc finger CCCH domain-containing protein 39-like n=1 Tax=Phoenix dactylifera TaxID=42345 RepID=A0A8B7BTG2_PHODC|nr:zinc finger CCCH domain-containing protein 39-like [Phoenix dactylifera]XP_008785034.1 zinc finger CCCH domain-containing protein 39-like [Phoenix dactylifera]XP_008785044.1 zinc finger CCCH domain-containing protein 39-like [Phoenix dactylifera]